MIVICLTNCPPKLRGDLTKWLLEVNTGVYVGNINARVRDELWKRITENIRSGQATMVFSSSGEQRMDFRVHNTTWKPVDFDGLKLIARPNLETAPDEDRVNLSKGFSKAAKFRTIRQMRHSASQNQFPYAYTIVDLETTGLNYSSDTIIEIAALRVRGGIVEAEFNYLVNPNRSIPDKIVELTGISQDLAIENGMPLEMVLTKFTEFIEKDKLLCWNAPFDISFLQIGCKNCGIPIIRNRAEDLMKLAKRHLKGLPSYRLRDVAKSMGIKFEDKHRALSDCYLAQAVFKKLNENSSDE
ncbi:type I-E CRISPR-associated endoribonuclease Cas2 [bacterium]|nr:type I-E CRISPR-associated endoribonuclease Cas2 [bacterium]